MKLFDALVKLNTFVVVLAAMLGLSGSFFFNKDPHVALPFNQSPREISAVVAGAYDDAPPATPTPTRTPTPTPLPVAEPIHIDIPSLKLSADVVHVGVTDKNVMEVPANFDHVGWFNKSLKPGESGSKAAIMSGHFDRTNGSPAVFYGLETLRVGDEVIVSTADGVRYVFSVESSFSHPLEDFPTDIVYGAVTGSHLKLITCDGVWHADKKSYSNRLVIDTKLIRIERPAESLKAI